MLLSNSGEFSSGIFSALQRLMATETAHQLKQHIPDIINLWEKKARQQIAAAPPHTVEILQNLFKEFLTALSDGLLDGEDRPVSIRAQQAVERVRLSRLHGESRASQTSYHIDEVIFEYHLLRETIFEFLESNGYRVPDADRELILNTIEQAVNDAATAFSKTLRDLQERITLTLAHDLRGPLSVAQTGSELIIENPGDPTLVRQMAEIIQRNLKEVDSMIRDLLDAAKIQAGGGIDLHFTACDLAQIVREAIQNQILKRARNPFILEMTGHEKILGFWSETGLKRVLENLLSNAVKYGERNAPITVGLDQGQGMTTLKVHNEGNPIPKVEQKRLFQKFYRSKSARNKRPYSGGWGLGLIFVKGIVESHHGRVRVESSKGGTDFIVELPSDVSASAPSRPDAGLA